MSSWLQTTNKRLHFARIQLEAWACAGSLECTAFREGYLLEMHLAWRSLLCEVLESYGFKNLTGQDLKSAKEQCDKKGVSSSELMRLQQEHEQDWLQSLERGWQQLFEPYQAPSNSTVQTAPAGTIPLFEVDSVLTPDLPLSHAEDYYERLKALVGHCRNFNLEW